MRKIIWILIILLFSAGCAVSKKKKSSVKPENVRAVSGDIYKNLVNQNLTSRNFFIEKAEFRIIRSGSEKSGIGTIKFIMPDKYLISLKSNAGIEIARIYITKDSLMINDRLNKKFYFGASSFLKQKYGLTTALLPVIFGDYVNEEKSEKENLVCKDGKVNIDAVIGIMEMEYVVDCKYGKSILISPSGVLNNGGIKIEYDKFFSSDGLNIPGSIKLFEEQNNTSIEIRIQKIIFPWEGSIEFIPGKQYEKIKLQ